ncbi:MAG TPA: ATP-binding protein [Burkholderiales bacterium]|nr:ATP-binding protein [Burkholderiales bacterium]
MKKCRGKKRNKRAGDRAAPKLVDRLAFERLLAELASRFADVPASAVTREIQSALKRLVDFFGYDRCTYSEFAVDGTLNIVASAAVPSVGALRPGPFGEERAWFLGEVRAGRPVVLPALPKGLPADAKSERDYVKASGLRSHLSIPLRTRGRTTGVLSFAGFRRARDWPQDLIVRLTIIAEVFASAAARASSEEEAHRLRTRLWHADRVARISALTAAIAHEINQPLTAILSNAQAGLANLERGAAAPEEIRAIFEAVVRDDKRAAETIRTMRAFLRQEENGRERIDLASALHDVLGLLSSELARKGIGIEARLEPECWVSADKTQIEQVALNLLLNAAQAMEGCPPEERLIRLRAARAGDGHVAVEVRDAGVGIKAEDLQAVFEPFWTTRKEEGLGLGLAICRSIVEAHGGEIRVEPNPGRGVTFRFELPAEVGAGRPTPEASEDSPVKVEAERLAAGPVVCVVDDDAAVRASLARLLAAQDWPVASYASAIEFLERQPLAAVGCILLDHQMPGMSGPELQQHLAHFDAAPPVVFLTGRGDLAAGVHAMKLGAEDFIVKPPDANVLYEAVRKALARHAAEIARTRSRDESLGRLGRLSGREREVMIHVVRGRLNKQIAADLHIALQTVKQHRGRVMEKLQVRSVAELVQIYSRLEATPERQM